MITLDSKQTLMTYLKPLYDWYGRFERPISSLSLVLGFVFDAVTLQRVDTLWENLWIFGHLLIVAVFIVLIHARENTTGDEADPSKAQFWYVNILQFFFGGILSTYLVFYFRSADIFVTWPFLAILAIAFLANESMKRHYVRFSFQISLFFLSVYSFAIFLLPVVLHRIGSIVFIASGLVSLIFILLFISVLFRFVKQKFLKERASVISVILIIFVVVNVLYFFRLIPPIPLSLKDGGVYHSILRSAQGDYDVIYEDHGWRDYVTMYPVYTEVGLEPVYAYSAVFSPTKLDLIIVHEWQRYDEAGKIWLTDNVVRLPVVGGRGNGFRTYSFDTNLESGKWRVNIETEDGHIIGRLRFTIVKDLTNPPLTQEKKH